MVTQLERQRMIAVVGGFLIFLILLLSAFLFGGTGLIYISEKEGRTSALLCFTSFLLLAAFFSFLLPSFINRLVGDLT